MCPVTSSVSALLCRPSSDRTEPQRGTSLPQSDVAESEAPVSIGQGSMAITENAYHSFLPSAFSRRRLRLVN